MARRWLYLVALVLALSLLVSTGGFSAVNADRSVSVSVVPDDQALLGIAQHNVELDNGRHDDVTLVTLENQFPEDLSDVQVWVHEDDDQRAPKFLSQNSSVVSVSGELGVGESVPVRADVGCSNAGGSGSTEEWTVRVVASGGSAEVELNRTVSVTCTGEPSST